MGKMAAKTLKRGGMQRAVRGDEYESIVQFSKETLREFLSPTK